MRVRTVEESDAGRVAELLTQLGYSQAADEVRPRLAGWLADPTSRVLVADEDGVAVGVLALHAVPLFERPGRWGRIVALVVDEAQRGRGVGRLLVEAAHAAAAELGCGDMEVTSSRVRVAAHAFYCSLGHEELSDRAGRFMRTL